MNPGPLLDEGAQLRKARGRFLSMALTYFCGVFNDNFFKQSALVLAVAAGRTEMQGYSIVVFTLPFVLFAAPAGWMSDRFPKRRVVIGAKLTEFVAMLFGAAGICLDHWGLIFAMLGIMGLQAAFFSPALNGTLPELYPESYVMKANGFLRMFVTTAILGGVALAGIALDTRWNAPWGLDPGRLLVAISVIVTALVGLLVSLGIPHRPAAAPATPFPWAGPFHTLRQLWNLRADPILGLTVLASTFIWFAGSLEILLINPLGLQQFQLTKTHTSFLIVDQLLGIGIGGLLAGSLAARYRWTRVVTPAGFVMALVMLAFPLVPSLPDGIRLPALFALIALVGVAGGMFMIPVDGFLQIRPPRERKGTTLAAANFSVFLGVLLSGFVANLLNAHFLPTSGFFVLGIFALAICSLFAVGFRTTRW